MKGPRAAIVAGVSDATGDGILTASYAGPTPDPGGGRAVAVALGVTSLCVAGLGLIVGFVGAAWWAVEAEQRVSEVQAAEANAAVTTEDLNTPDAPPELPDLEQAGAVADGLDAVSPLPPGGRERLVKALQKVPLPLAPPADGGAWTADGVAAQVTGVALDFAPGEAGGYSHEYSLGVGVGTIDLNHDGTVSVYDYSGTHDWYSVVIGPDGDTRYERDTDYGMGLGGPNPPSAAAAWAGLGLTLLHVLLSGLLLAAGVLALRRSGWAPLFHRLWAVAKLVAVAALVGVGVRFAHGETQFGVGYYGYGRDGEAALLRAVAPGLLVGFISAIYPVVVLIALAVRPVREVFRPG